ncbi:homocysteine S-methyltransferase 4-like isoform X2 [Portunus trituberculatus]|nr:homocysteine S-methyltransferase 4-like isoform X2 [Portunus trituberculatus]
MLGSRYTVVDGGLASTLQAGGYEVDGDPLWSARLLATHPHAIKKVHTAFLEAGAEVLVCGSYQASVSGFQQHLSTTREEALALIGRSATLALDAVQEFEKGERGDHPKVVAGSVGPYGACQADGSEYTGSYIPSMTQSDLMTWHRPRLEALAGAGLRVVALETLPALSEALALLGLLREFPDLKAWVTFSCKDAKHTSYGDHFGEAVKACYEQGRDQLIAVGVNCSPPHLITPLLQEASQLLPSPKILPRVVYPNSGEEWVAGKGWKARGDEISWPFLDEVGVWAEMGAQLVGGCCRLGPVDIANIAGVLRSLPDP